MKKVIVKIDGKEALFSNLSLTQQMCDLHTFRFNYQIESPNGVTINTYYDFYEGVLDKSIEITVEQKPIFEGYVASIECINQYDAYIDFEIKGHCKMTQLNAVKECKSFYKKTPADIFKALTKDIPSEITPIHNEVLHYTVQYNYSAFEMLQMLCKREGEWFYYDGKKIIIKKPESSPIKLDQKKNEIFNIKLDVKMPKGANALLAYDTIKGNAVIEPAKKQDAKDKTLASIPKSKQFIAGAESIYQTETVPFDDYVKRSKEKYETQRVSETVVLKARSNSNAVALGTIIEVMNEDKSEGTYVVTKVTHYSPETSIYQNDLEAIPNVDKYAFYVDPEVKIESAPTYAIVTQNEDEDGLSRIKVKFYWASGKEESCWMDLITPHAGAGKGFRFLPDIGDEVMVDFYDNNIEAPYAIGAVYSNNRKDGEPQEGNYIKTIATKTNRRIQFDEKRGLLFLTDFYGKEEGGNSIHLEKKDDKQLTHIYSRKDEKNQSIIQVDTKDGINIFILDDNKETIQIKLDREGQKIKIFAKKEITVHSENEVNVKASNIKIEGEQSIKMRTKKFELESDEIKVEAQMKLEMNGGQKLDLSSAQTAVKGDMMLDLNGGAQAVLKGGMVMIN